MTAIGKRKSRITMHFVRKPIDAEDIPLGSLIRTPLGKLAKVEGYRGKRRGHRVWLMCRYLAPENKAFDLVPILPELVVIVVDELKEAA